MISVLVRKLQEVRIGKEVVVTKRFFFAYSVVCLRVSSFLSKSKVLQPFKMKHHLSPSHYDSYSLDKISQYINLSKILGCLILSTFLSLFHTAITLVQPRECLILNIIIFSVQNISWLETFLENSTHWGQQREANMEFQ